jgi:hypothetical protein
MPTTRLICVFALLSLGACSGTVPASGETSDGETFSGTFSRRSDGIGGVVALRSDKGTNCEGRWQLDEDQTGEDQTGSAVLICSDGRTGTAQLSARQPAGTMKGMLGGKPFSGRFQDPVRSTTP